MMAHKVGARRATPLALQREIAERREAVVEQRLNELVSEHSADTVTALRGRAAQEGYELLQQAPNAYMRCLLSRSTSVTG